MSVLKTIAKRYLDVPQLITTSAFEEIANLLDMKEGRAGLQSYFAPMSSEDKLKIKMADPFYSGYRFDEEGSATSTPADYGVIKVEGPLTYKPEVNMCAPDTCNYQELVKQVEAYAAEGKKRIFMIHDSPGGEAFAMFSTSKRVRKIADENGIELIGYVDGLSASASYGWLSVCDKIYASESSSIGSIGVVISLMNNSGALEKAGLKRQFITAGASKVPFSDEGEFKEEFLADLQDNVDTLYEKFVNHVDTYREGMTADSIKSTEAKVFQADKALELGLIDEIMEVAEFKEKYLTGESASLSSSITTPKNKAQTMSKELNVDMAAFEAMKEKLATFEKEEAQRTLSAKKETIKTQLSGAEAFLSNMDSVVEFLSVAEEAQASLLSGVIAEATAALATQKEEAAATLNDAKEKLSDEIKALKEEKETLLASKETIKEEFAQPEAIRDEEKESNLETLGHKEKLARAVAAAKAKQA